MNPSQPTLTSRITTNVQRMTDLLTPLSDDLFFAPKHGKWSSAETLQHLFLSARVLPRMLAGPRSLFEQWPRSGRTSRPYDEMAASYEQTLRATGIKAPVSFIARPEDMQLSKADMLNRFLSTHAALADCLAGWSADELDTWQIPHPALELITVGEMMHFTAYHIEHHRLTELNLLKMS